MLPSNLECKLMFAELLKINHYKAPRDKMICILNCCKVIFGGSRKWCSPSLTIARADTAHLRL